MNYSRGQERDERAKLGTGLRLSVFGLIFCWLPFVGLILAAAGFIKIFVRITGRHKKRRAAYMAVSLVVLIACTGVLMGEVRAYINNPNIVQDTGMWLYTKLTGQSELPGSTLDDTNYTGGIDYGESGGMGYDPNLYNTGEEGGGEDGGQDEGWDDGWDEGEDLDGEAQ